MLETLQKATLNAPVRELEEWMSSGAASVSCVGLVWRDASMQGHVASRVRLYERNLVATWGDLLEAVGEAGLNAPVRELLEWMSSGGVSSQ